MTTARVDYHIRPYEPADEPAVLALLARTLAGGPTGQRTPEFFRWKHERNPFGPSPAFVAVADGQVIGFRTFMRWRFRVGGSVVRALRPVDTATDPAHQGKGVFTRLTRAALEALAGEADLLFNTPNAQSLPGYLKLGWSVVGRVPIAIRPLRPLRWLRGLPQARSGAPPQPPPPVALPSAAEVLGRSDVADLLHPGPTDRLVTDRSVAYLRWRYADAPDLDYRGIVVEDGGRLRALALARPRYRGPLAELTLSELLVRPDDRAAARALLRAAARVRLDHVATHLTPGTVLASAGPRAGYLPAFGRGMTLVVHALQPLPVEAERLDAWRFSLGDLETF